jgi:hypothetical protein
MLLQECFSCCLALSFWFRAYSNLTSVTMLPGAQEQI